MRVNIQTKILLAFIVATLLIGGEAIFSAALVNDAIEDSMLRTETKYRTTGILWKNIGRASTDVLQYQISPQDEYITDFEDATHAINNGIQSYVSQKKSIDDNILITRLKEEYKVFSNLGKRLIATRKEQNALLSRFRKQMAELIALRASPVEMHGGSITSEIKNKLDIIDGVINEYVLSPNAESKNELSAELKQLTLLISEKYSGMSGHIKSKLIEIESLSNKIIDISYKLNDYFHNYGLSIKNINSIILDLRTQVKNESISDEDHVDNLRLLKYLLLTGSMGLNILIGLWLSHKLSDPILKLKEVAWKIGRGEVDVDCHIDSHDETRDLSDSLKTMIENNKKIADAAGKLGMGIFNIDIGVRSDKDILGKSIEKMRNNLKELTSKNDEENWKKTNLASAFELAQSQKTNSDIASRVINFCAEGINAGHAAFYMVVADEKSNEKILKLYGSYAYKERKDLSNIFKIGEGIVGQCALEKKSIFLSKIPDDYIHITSGLGEGTPSNLFVLPVIFENDVVAVMEFAKFEEIKPVEIEFLEKLSSSIGIVINNCHNREITERLLKESQIRGEELKKQQEELKASNEELEQQAAVLESTAEKLEAQQEELRAANEELEEKSLQLQGQNKKLEETKKDLDMRIVEINEASKYKSEFLANMSHELRTPLNSLLILSQLLVENKEGTLTSDQLESAKIIHNGGKNLLTLINDILDLSKVEAGRMGVNLTSCNIKETMDSLKKELNPLASQKNIVLDFNVDPDAPESIVTDPQRLQQIIKNLVSNGIKFTEDGSVIVTVFKPKNKIVFENKNLSQETVIGISVKDTGMGIPKDKQGIIFEAFQQVSGGINRKHSGTGLGLTISRELTRLLNGELQFTSELGSGSTFVLYLPLEMGDKNSSQLIKNDRAHPGTLIMEGIDLSAALTTKKSILVIDDQENFLSSINKLIEDRGYRSINAKTGEEGIDKAKIYQPTGIILDLGLPGIDGLKVINSLKSDVKTRDIPVHIISAKDLTFSYLEHGAIGYLRKPVSVEELDTAFSKIESFSKSKIKKLLVIDDEEDTRKAVSLALKKKNIETYHASLGEEGIKMIMNESYDCVVLDLALPDISGFDVLKRLSNNKLKKIPPVIIYTAKPINDHEYKILCQYTPSIVIKGLSSIERLQDEIMLFFHDIMNENENLDFRVRNVSLARSVLDGKTALLVDDDVKNNFALCKVLGNAGLHVIMADNGMLAIEKLKSNPQIDIIFMDIMMPNMDGYETIEAIRKNKKFKNLPIIALTAMAMSEDKSKCLEVGANDYLTKPVSIEELLNTARVWITAHEKD